MESLAWKFKIHKKNVSNFINNYPADGQFIVWLDMTAIHYDTHYNNLHNTYNQMKPNFIQKPRNVPNVSLCIERFTDICRGNCKYWGEYLNNGRMSSRLERFKREYDKSFGRYHLVVIYVNVKNRVRNQGVLQ